MPKPFIERKNNAVLDAQELENQGYTDIHFQGIHLTGGTESSLPHNECFFGELDSKDSNMGLNINKPIYYLQGNEDLSSADSNATSTLQVFLNNSTLTILNYSLLDSSLNIKLECTSSESKEIIQQEIDCHEAKASRNDNKESISTALLHPLLEDNELKCPHNGIVKLKSIKGKPFKSKGIPMILESDLLNSSIVGCTNNMAGVPTPCTLVSLILPTSMGYKKYALTIKNRICKIKVWYNF